MSAGETNDDGFDLARGQRTIVLYETDCQAIKDLREAALREFATVSVNDIVRAALRLANRQIKTPSLCRDFLRQLEAARAEDGRRKPLD